MFGYETRDGISMEESFHGRVSFFEREARLAKNFVLKSRKPDMADHALCPVCGARVNKIFFEKWSLSYFLCGECWTTFAPSLADEVKEFEKDSPLAVLRRGEEYQQNADASRNGAWQSLVNWIGHRIFRYMDAPDACAALIRGVRYRGLLHLLRRQPMLRRLDVKGSILVPDTFRQEEYDAVLYLDTLQRRTAPLPYLERAYGFLRSGGLFFITTRVGTGFDLLTLKGRSDTLSPTNTFSCLR
jgi:hypothetical protein